MTLTVLHHPDPRLRTVAEPVSVLTPEIQQLIDDLLETMRTHDALGLAAPQVGVGLRVFVVAASVGAGVPGHPIVIVNPQLELLAGLEPGEEGCLSLPGITSSVRRATRLRVTTADRITLQPYTFQASDLLARVIQHETDHLNGVLMIDNAAGRWRRRRPKG